MCRELICLMSFVLVLGMTAASPAGLDDDPNLVGWWKFDGDTTDGSGKGHHGTLMGDPAPVFVDGMIDQALDTTEPDGPGYVEITGYKGILGANPFSIAMWINTSDVEGTMMGWGSTAGGATRVEFRINADRLRCESSGNVQGNTTLPNNEWIHVAVTAKAGAMINDPDVTLYLNGQVDNMTSTGSNNPLQMAAGFDVTIARRHSGAARWLDALIDDVRLYDRELTAEEVKKLATPPRAHKPSPEDDAIHGDTWVSLAWSASYDAVSHDVYLGDNFDDVIGATPESSVFRGNQTSPSYPVGFSGFAYPDGLVPGTTYYWRVDEVLADGTKQRGQVWSFRIPPLTAYEPVPVYGDLAVPADMKLSWSLGLKGIMHGVYFGTDRDQVTNGVGAPPHLNTTYDPGPLANATTYYWRVDTFNGAAWITGPVWTFSTRPIIPLAADPNFIAWWKLDERPGTHILDWSGHNNNGTFRGDPKWVDGYDGGALQFDGSGDYVNIDGYKGIVGAHARTVTAWVKTTSTTGGVIVGWGVNTSGQRMELRIDVGRLRCEHQGGNVQGSTNLTDGGWHHVAVTLKDGATVSYPEVKLYLDGVDDTIPTTDPDAFVTVAGNDVRIGSRPSNNDRFFTGLIDDVRLYDKELTQQELELVMRIDLLPAWRPTPKDGATPDIEHVTPLAWARGDKATQHEVYFGTDRAVVADANASDTTGIYRGRQSAASFTPAEGLAWGGGPYFWRVDENNNDGTVTKGKIWSFTVGDFLVVDDIESYNDLAETDPASKRIYLSWIDGFGTTTNGALVGNANVPLTERANVHGGGQAMPLSYDNNLKFSEATLTLTAGKDWTRQGVGELSLWFRGLATNGAERMYVALNGTAVVYHADPNVAQTAAWTEWVIPLQQFADQGVNLTNVTSITIGFGTRGNTTTAGGTGVVFFDDIRLRHTPVVPVVPVLATAPPDAYDPTRASAVPAP